MLLKGHNSTSIGFSLILVVTCIISQCTGDAEVTCVNRESCILPCTFTGEIHEIIWFKTTDMHPVQWLSKYRTFTPLHNYQDRATLFSDHGNASLLLRDVEPNDNGTYKCSIWTSKGRNITFINLKVNAPVGAVRVDLMSSALACSSEGIYPKPVLSWSSVSGLGSDIRYDKEQDLFSITGFLRVSHITPHQRYSCNISNGHNWRRATFMLNPPVVSSGPEVTLSCSGSSHSFPSAKLNWIFRGTQPIVNLSGLDQSYTVSDQWRPFIKRVSETGSLVLKDLGPQKQGLYICVYTIDNETFITNTQLEIHVLSATLAVVVFTAAAITTALVFCCTYKKDQSQESSSTTKTPPSSEGSDSSSSPPDQPAPDHPTSDHPTLDQPASDQPTSDQPASVQPASVQPASVQPASVQPASDHPTSDQPASVQPASVQPASVQPASVQPASDQPASDQPASVQPASVQPASDHPTSDQPASVQPASVQPASVQPASVQPASDQPASDQPASDQPSSVQPTSDQPASDHPTSDQPASDQPTSDQSTSDQPASDHPTSDQPASDQPTSDQSTSDQPASDHPTSDQPTSDQSNSDQNNFKKVLVFTLGVGSLLPWHIYLTASLYFKEHFTTALWVLTITFMMLFSRLLQLLPFLLKCSGFLHRFSLQANITYSLVLIPLLFLTNALLTKFLMLQANYFCLTMSIMWFSMFFSAFLQNIRLLPNCIFIFTQGQSAAGIFSAFIMILSISITTDSAAFWHFIFGFSGSLIILFSYLGLSSLVPVHLYVNSSRKFRKASLVELLDQNTDKALIEHNIQEATEQGKTNICILLKNIKCKALCVVCVPTVTLSVFPAITTDVASVLTGNWMFFFIPVCCFLIFNIFNLIGIVIANQHCWPVNSALIPVLVVIRVVFIVFIFCNVQSRAVLPATPFLSHDGVFAVIMALFSLSNGCLGVLSESYALNRMEGVDSETAAVLKSVLMGAGMFLGAALSFALTAVI